MSKFIHLKWTRNTTKFLLFFALIAGIIFLTSHATLASSHEPVPAPSGGAASEAGTVLKGTLGLVLTVIRGVLMLVRGLLASLTGFTGGILSHVFWMNIATVPTGLFAVTAGWAIMRDIANALLLLVILWIALGIIFNLEKWGSPKMLIRVLMVALLINFSLVMVTAVFGFANTVAAVFASKIEAKNNDIAGFIINATKIHTITNEVDEQGLDALKQNYQQQQNTNQEAPGEGLGPRPATASFKDIMLASVGIKTAHAQWWGAAAGCGLAALLILFPIINVGAGALCVGGAIAGALVNILGKSAVDNFFDNQSTAVINLALGSLFLLMLTVLFIIAAATLLIRIVMMSVLAVFAPAAFLFYALPGDYGKKYWNSWLSHLVNWAVFAPIFYFMLYLTLFMLYKYDSLKPPVTKFTVDFDRVLMFLFTFIMLFIALRLTRKTGGAIADTAVNLVSKAGLLATGALAGGAVAGGAAILKRTVGQEQAEALAVRARRIPLVGRRIERAITKLPAERQEDIKKRATELGRYSNDQLADHFSRSTGSLEKAAASLTLAQRGGEAFAKLNPDNQKMALGLTKRFGMEKELLKASPHLATRELVSGTESDLEAKIKTMKHVEDKTKLSKEAYQDDETILAMLANLRGRKELQRIAQETPAVYDRIRKVMMTRHEDLEKIYKDLNEKGVKNEGDALKTTLEIYHQHHLAQGGIRGEEEEDEEDAAGGGGRGGRPRGITMPPGAGQRSRQEEEERREWFRRTQEEERRRREGRA